LLTQKALLIKAMISTALITYPVLVLLHQITASGQNTMLLNALPLSLPLRDGIFARLNHILTPQTASV